MCPPVPRDQPEARTNPHCSITVRYAGSAKTDIRSQRGGTSAGVYVGVWGGRDLRIARWTARTKFCLISKIHEITNIRSLAHIGYLSCHRQVDYGYPRAWTSWQDFWPLAEIKESRVLREGDIGNDITYQNSNSSFIIGPTYTLKGKWGLTVI